MKLKKIRVLPQGQRREVQQNNRALAPCAVHRSLGLQHSHAPSLQQRQRDPRVLARAATSRSPGSYATQRVQHAQNLVAVQRVRLRGVLLHILHLQL